MNSFMSWVGGKKSLRDKIIIRFPLEYGRYIEVFGGAGWVLFHKTPDKFEVFNDANSDSKPYITSSLGIEGAWTPFSRFTVLPTLRVGWYSLEDRSLMNPRHIVGVGGFMPNRYVENQLPFFGFATGDRECRPLSGVAQLDLRYRVGRVDYLTLRGGLFNDDYNLTDYFNSYPVYAIGAEYSRQSIAGPLKLAFQWCNIVDGISAYVSVGFDF